MRIQLWSYNYAPEPQGIAPLSTVLAQALRDRSHKVLVVAAHPHYPQPAWGARVKPYRERRNGVPVLRLPLILGREGGLERVLQELSFTAGQTLVAPLLPPCDVLVAVSPSFPALAPCMAVSRLRRTPLVLWLQDIVTDAATSTGLLAAGPLLDAARRFELSTYRSAARIVVISEAFRDNLRLKGVPDEKIVRILNPMSQVPTARQDPWTNDATAPRVLAMGNIGLSQGLDQIVDAFEGSHELAAQGAELVFAGHGVEAGAVLSRIRSRRVRMLGVLGPAELELELKRARLGLVSQRADISEFNLPSKLMNYMAYGVPVIASVRPDSETARLVRASGAGWVTDARRMEEFARTTARVLADPPALARASEAGYSFARECFSPEGVAQRFERVLHEARGHQS